jgi:hypothetical protein
MLIGKGGEGGKEDKGENEMGKKERKGIETTRCGNKNILICRSSAFFSTQREEMRTGQNEVAFDYWIVREPFFCMGLTSTNATNFATPPPHKSIPQIYRISIRRPLQKPAMSEKELYVDGERRRGK